MPDSSTTTKAATGSFLYEALAASLSEMIHAGTLQPGDRLPSVRRLSRQRSISVSTVLQAYRQLEDRRLVEARPQSGYYVRPQVRNRPVEPQISTPPAAATAVQVTDLVTAVLAAVDDPSVVPLGAAVPSPDLLPTARLNRMLGAVVRRDGAQSNTYMSPQGFLPLRQEIARRALDWGCTLSADDLIITNGCIEALSLCLRAVTRPGDTVAVESPAYFGVLQMLESLGLKTLEIPTHPRHGISVTALEEALVDASAEAPVAACLLTPNFHNPLGSLMPEASKRDVVALCHRHQLPIIEDDLYGDLYFEGPRPWSLKAFDRDGLVMQCNSYSKTLAPGYRIGWAAAGRFQHQVQQLKLASTFATAAPLQMAIAAFLQTGHFDHHLRGLRRAFAGNLERMTQAVAAFFPAGTMVTRPLGGFVLWVELPPTVSALALHRAALRHAISIAPGPMFSSTGQYGHCIRLNGGYPWSDRIEEALQRLGHLAGTLA